MSKSSGKPAPKGTAKIKATMNEFRSGTLHSGSGQLVENPKQAVAIGLSQQRKADARSKKK